MDELDLQIAEMKQKWYEDNFYKIKADREHSQLTGQPRTIMKPHGVSLSDEFRKKLKREVSRKWRESHRGKQENQKRSEYMKNYLTHLEQTLSDDEMKDFKQRKLKAVRLAQQKDKMRFDAKLDPMDPETYPKAEYYFIKKFWPTKWEVSSFIIETCLELETLLKAEWESHGFFGVGEHMWKYIKEGVAEDDAELKEALEWKKMFLEGGFFKLIGPKFMRVGEAYIYPWFALRWALEEGAEGISKLLINYYGNLTSPEAWGPHVVHPGDLNKKVFKRVKVCERVLNRARSQVAKDEIEMRKQRLEKMINDVVF